MAKNSSRFSLENPDVLIVGYGPVGAAVAALLGRYGVRTTVIDKGQDVLMMPRAIALDNEALRILQMAGLDDQSFERIGIQQVRMHSPYMGQFGRVNTSGTIDGHPKLVTFYQPDLEKALRNKVAQHACVNIQYRCELVDLQQLPDSVEAVIRNADGQEQRISARFVVGADGANSKVRELIGQSFEGQTYSEDWLIVDANQRGKKAIDHVEFLCDPRRPTPHMLAPGGRERWEFMLLPGETREQMEKPEKLAELLSPWIKPDELTIERQAVYRFHARCCDRFQKGRIFLVGDAAHITPPFVGQGLVAGLRDAANLSWKLSAVVSGRSPEKILDSYDQERRPHARKMIDLAKMMGKLVMPSTTTKAVAVHGLMRMLRVV
ncbi:MAG: bifunctional 3-(3-hydroxy-phenyl)propionate/3-hydroxycinnamic acid hydroxylase, partial [Pseudomonadota bacterium]